MKDSIPIDGKELYSLNKRKKITTLIWVWRKWEELITEYIIEQGDGIIIYKVENNLGESSNYKY